MDNNEYISKQKVEKWTTKEKFNALGDLRDIEPGTEYNLTGAIEEGELDSALQTKINGKLTAPATPTAESAVTMLADGTVGTKLLSEFGGGGKLYMHNLSILVKTGETLNGTIIGSIISTNNAPITKFTNTMLKQTMIDVTIYKGSTTGYNNIYLTDRKVSDLSSISTAGNISVYAYSAGTSTYPFSNNLEETFSGTSQTVYDTVTEL